MSASASARIRIGVGGWNYERWRGAFYPKGVPHGWSEIPEGGVTYLSVRPDPKKVLEHGYVNPAIK